MHEGPIIPPSLEPVQGFLSSNAQKVFDWFGIQYTSRLANINSIPNIFPAAKNFANERANQARQSAISSANAFTNAKVAGIANTFNNVIANLRGQIGDSVSALSIQIQNARSEATQNDQNILNQASGIAQTLFGQAQNTSNELTNNLRNEVEFRFGWVNQVRPVMDALTANVDVRDIPLLGDFLADSAESAQEFFKCPLCPIVEWLLDNLLDLLADLLADALGSVETDLGSPSDFTEGLEE